MNREIYNILNKFSIDLKIDHVIIWSKIFKVQRQHNGNTLEDGFGTACNLVLVELG